MRSAASANYTQLMTWPFPSPNSWPLCRSTYKTKDLASRGAKAACNERILTFSSTRFRSGIMSKNNGTNLSQRQTPLGLASLFNLECITSLFYYLLRGLSHLRENHGSWQDFLRGPIKELIACFSISCRYLVVLTSSSVNSPRCGITKS